MAVNAPGAVAGITAVVAAWNRRPAQAVTATAIQMLLQLGYWRQMVTYYERGRSAGARRRSADSAVVRS